MTTYNNTVSVTNGTSPGNQYTRNVVTGDTIIVTTNSAGGTVNAVPTNCSINGSTGTANGIANGGTCTVTAFTSSNYSILFSSTANGTNFTYATLSGTVTVPTAPVVNNSQSFAATASATTSCAIALTSTGSNGTLEYNKSTSTTVPTSGWQTSSTVSVTRGTSYYFWARRGVGYEDRTNSAIAVPYLANDLTGVAGTNSNIGPTATTASTTVSGVVANHTYVIIKNNGTYQRSATFTANGAVTISDNGVPSPAGLPALGGSFTYEFMAYRNQNVGGNPTFVQTNRTFTISRTPAAPTDLSFVTATTESNLTNVTPTASGGAAGGDLQVSLDNSTWFASGTSFGSRTRGTAHTWYARRLGSNGLASASYSEAHTPPYIAPDTTVTVTNDTIAWNATSATTTIGTANAVDQYFIRVNNGSTNLASRIGPGALAFTSGLPGVGATITYEIFSRKSIANGGDNGYDATNDTFTVTRLVEPVTTPTNLVMSTAATASATPLVTATASGGSGGTLQVSIDNSNWFANGTTFTRTRGTAYTFYARRVGSGSVSASYSEGYTPPYLAPDAAISAITSPDLAYGSTTHVVAIAGGNASDQYYVYNNAGSVNYGGRTGNGNITITHGVAAGGAATFRVYARKPVAIGGDNAFDNTGTTFEVEVFPNNVAISASNNNPSATSVTTTLSATGGQGGTIEYAKTSYSSTTTYAQNRGTTVTYYARSVGSNGLISQVSFVDHPVGYIAPDSAISAIASPDLAYGSTTHGVGIQNGGASDEYFVYNNAGTVNYGSRTGNGTITITHGVAAGGAATFRVYTRRPLAVGGDNAFDDTGTTFEVEVFPQTPTASVGFNNPNDNDVTATVTGSNTAGAASLAYSNGGAYVSGNTFAAVRGTGANYFVRSTGANGLTASGGTSGTPAYNAPDSAISAITSPDLAYGSTTHVVAIAGGSSIDEYYVYNNAGSVSYGGRTGNGNITITHGVAAGGAATFRVYARRPVAVGGDNAFDDTGTTFEVEVYPNNVVISVSNDNPNSASVTATLSATGGQGGTIEYAKFTYSATTTYAQNRGTTVTYYARSAGSNGLFSQVDFVDHTVGYNAPDSAISAITSPDLAYGSTTHVVAIAGGSSIDEYYVYNNAGSVSYGGRTGNGNITITHGVAAGGAATFRVYARRPVAVGGDNAFDNTGTTFEVEVYPQTPTASVGFNNPNDNDVTATVTGSNTAGANSLTYSNGGTYVAGNTFAAVRGTAANYFVRSTGANGLTATSAAAAATPGYNAPDAAISAITSPDLAYGSTTHVVAIAGGSSIDEYYVYNNAGSVSYGGRTGNGNITITHGVAAGGAATFRVYARRPLAVGGDNAFDNTGTTFEVEVFPNNVAISASNDNPELASVTTTISATGGQGGTIEYAKTSYSATTTYAQNRGTTVTYYARSVGSNGLISQVDFVDHTVGYIAPATYTVSDFTVLYDTASHFDLLNSLPANDNYEVLTGGYTGTVRGSQSGGGGSASVIEVTNINSPGQDVTYYTRGYRATAVGGDGLYDNMDTYVVGELPQASTVLGTFTDLGTESTSGTFRVIVTPGAGASTVQISLTSSSANLQNNDTDLANVVRAGDRIYTRTTAANGTVQDGFLDTPTTYLAPNTGSIAGTNDSILWAATTGSTTVSGVLSGHTYIIKKNNGSYRRSDTFTANGAVTISDQEVASPPGTPPQSSSASTYFYEFVVYRNVNAGGGQAGVINPNGTLSGGWTDTNRTFSITREKDPIIPVITVTGGTASVIVGDSYTDAGATATDNFAPANPTVIVVNPVDTSVIGVYTVTYNATDTAGNAATQKTRTVNVVAGTLAAFNTNQTDVELSSTNYAYAQYTGSTSNVLAARTAGTGTFVVTASATQPNASLFTSATKNIANGEYLHVKQTASSSYSTAVSSTYRVGGPGGDTSVHTVTTRARDYTMVPFVWGSSASGINPGQVVESPTKFITGADVGSQNAFSVSGNGAQYRLYSGGSFGAWTSTAGVIEQGVHSNVQIRGTASSAFHPTQTEITSTLANQSGTNGTQVFYIRNRSAIVDPDDFTFPNSAAQEKSTTNVTSASRTISGIEAEISVSVSGGEWRKFTTAWGGWTTSAGTVVNGNSVQVRGTASGSFSGTNVVTLNVGPDSPTFTIVTRDAIVDPDDFTFPDSAAQEPSATNVESAQRTISGIEADIAVSVSGTGAQWSTGGAYTSSPGTAQNGQAIVVRGTASASFDGTNVITLNVGPDSPTFTIVTRSIDDTPSNLSWLPVVGSQGSTVTSSSTITLANMTDSGTLTFSSNSIASLQMNIDSGGWVAAASVSVSNGTTVALRGTAPSYGTNTSVVTTIGQASSTFTIKSYPQTPSGLTTFTDGGTEDSSGTFTITVGGTTGAASTTITLSSNYTTNAVANGSAIASVVRSGDIVYARNTGSNGLEADAEIATPATYLDPNTGSIAGTNDTIEYSDTTATTTVSGVLSGHTYVVKKNNGDNDKPRSAIFTANGALTISDNGVSSPPGLPLVNNTFFYEFLVYRNTAAGGAGAPAVDDDWVETNRQFSVTRNSEAVTAPDGFNFTPTTTATANVSVTVQGTGGSGGTIEVSEDNTAWVANNSSFSSKTRGTEYTFYTRRVGSGSTSATYSEPYTPPYLDATLGITISEGSSLTIGTSDTQFILTVSGGNANDQYQVRDSSGTEHESRIGNGGITVTDTPAGNSETYTIFGRRPEAAGGDDNYVTTGVSILVVQETTSGIVPPAILSVTDDNANAASVTATVNLSSSGSGGTLNYAQTSTNSVPSSGWGTGNTFTHTRNTTRYYWASQSTNTLGAYDSLSKFVGNYTTAVYGIQIRNVSGTLTLDTADRVSGIVSRGSFQVTTGTTDVSTYGTPQYVGTSSAITFVGMEPQNEEEFEVWVSGNIPTAQFGLTNFSINRGTGSYTVTYKSYTSNQTITVPYFNVRY